MTSAPSMPAPQPAPPVPTVTSSAVQQAGTDAQTAAAQAAGRASTLLTGGQGDQASATVAKKTLLGG